MKKLFVILVILLICIAGVGFYRSWFVVSSPGPNPESNEVNINLSVDPDKVKADVETVKEKATGLSGNETEEAKEPADQTSDKNEDKS